MRRDTVWGGLVETTTNIVGASTAVLFGGLSAGGLALRPFTIVRFRGIMHLASDQLANSELQHVAFGMSVVSDEALAIGVTAVPNPITARDSDMFFVYEELVNRFGVSSAVGIIQQGIAREFDSRAMRKVNDGQDIAVVVETSSISAGVNFVKAGRFLVKLH